MAGCALDKLLYVRAWVSCPTILLSLWAISMAIMEVDPPPGDLWRRAQKKLTIKELMWLKKAMPGDGTNVLSETESFLTKAEEEYKKKSLAITIPSRSGSRRKVYLRDIFRNVVEWLQVAVNIGDKLVQFDKSGQAALPWAVVKLIMEVVVSDIEKYDNVMAGIGTIANDLTFYSEWESLYGTGLPGGRAQEQFVNALVELYTSTLQYQADVIRYFHENRLLRIGKGGLSKLIPKDVFQERLDAIQGLEDDAARFANLLDAKRMELLDAKFDSMTQKLEDLAVTNAKGQDRILHAISSICPPVNAIMDKLEKNELERVLKWFSPSSAQSKHTSVYEKVLRGTGQWLLNHDSFLSWLHPTEEPMLWLHGHMGMGKSSLAAIVIEDLLALSRAKQDAPPPPLFFYCERRSDTTTDQKDILAALARQLAYRSSDMYLYRKALKIFDKYRYDYNQLRALRADVLIDIVTQLIQERPISWIVLDALDECAEPSTMYRALQKIIERSRIPVKIFVTSRNDTLELQSLIHKTKNIAIGNDHDLTDLERFVKRNVRRKIKIKKLRNAVKEPVITHLLKHADGMFRWVEMRLEELCLLDYREVDDVAQAFVHQPPELSMIYNTIYANATTDEQGSLPRRIAEATISWLLHASIPLPIQHLLRAVEIYADAAKIHGFVDTTRILKLLPSFFTISYLEIGEGDWRVRPCSTLNFAHLSVREHFETHPNFVEGRSHSRIAISCFRVLQTYADDFARRQDVLQRKGAIQAAGHSSTREPMTDGKPAEMQADQHSVISDDPEFIIDHFRKSRDSFITSTLSYGDLLQESEYSRLEFGNPIIHSSLPIPDHSSKALFDRLEDESLASSLHKRGSSSGSGSDGHDDATDSDSDDSTNSSADSNDCLWSSPTPSERLGASDSLGGRERCFAAAAQKLELNQSRASSQNSSEIVSIDEAGSDSGPSSETDEMRDEYSEGYFSIRTDSSDPSDFWEYDAYLSDPNDSEDGDSFWESYLDENFDLDGGDIAVGGVSGLRLIGCGTRLLRYARSFWMRHWRPCDFRYQVQHMRPKMSHEEDIELEGELHSEANPFLNVDGVDGIDAWSSASGLAFVLWYDWFMQRLVAMGIDDEEMQEILDLTCSSDQKWNGRLLLISCWFGLPSAAQDAVERLEGAPLIENHDEYSTSIEFQGVMAACNRGYPQIMETLALSMSVGSWPLLSYHLTRLPENDNGIALLELYLTQNPHYTFQESEFTYALRWPPGMLSVLLSRFPDANDALFQKVCHAFIRQSDSSRSPLLGDENQKDRFLAQFEEAPEVKISLGSFRLLVDRLHPEVGTMDMFLALLQSTREDLAEIDHKQGTRDHGRLFNKKTSPNKKTMDASDDVSEWKKSHEKEVTEIFFLLLGKGNLIPGLLQALIIADYPEVIRRLIDLKVLTRAMVTYDVLVTAFKRSPTVLEHLLSTRNAAGLASYQEILRLLKLGFHIEDGFFRWWKDEKDMQTVSASVKVALRWAGLEAIPEELIATFLHHSPKAFSFFFRATADAGLTISTDMMLQVLEKVDDMQLISLLLRQCRPSEVTSDMLKAALKNKRGRVKLLTMLLDECTTEQLEKIDPDFLQFAAEQYGFTRMERMLLDRSIHLEADCIEWNVAAISKLEADALQDFLGNHKGWFASNELLVQILRHRSRGTVLWFVEHSTAVLSLDALIAILSRNDNDILAVFRNRHRHGQLADEDMLEVASCLQNRSRAYLELVFFSRKSKKMPTGFWKQMLDSGSAANASQMLEICSTELADPTDWNVRDQDLIAAVHCDDENVLNAFVNAWCQAAGFAIVETHTVSRDYSNTPNGPGSSAPVTTGSCIEKSSQEPSMESETECSTDYTALLHSGLFARLLDVAAAGNNQESLVFMYSLSNLLTMDKCRLDRIAKLSELCRHCDEDELTDRIQSLSSLLAEGTPCDTPGRWGIRPLNQLASSNFTQGCTLFWSNAGSAYPGLSIQEVMIELLVKDGASLDAVDDLGRTALMAAAQYYQFLAVDSLLRLGADPTLRDINGTTAGDLARENMHWAMADELDVAAAAWEEIQKANSAIPTKD